MDRPLDPRWLPNGPPSLRTDTREQSVWMSCRLPLRPKCLQSACNWRARGWSLPIGAVDARFVYYHPMDQDGALAPGSGVLPWYHQHVRYRGALSWPSDSSLSVTLDSLSDPHGGWPRRRAVAQQRLQHGVISQWASGRHYRRSRWVIEYRKSIAR